MQSFICNNGAKHILYHIILHTIYLPNMVGSSPYVVKFLHFWQENYFFCQHTGEFIEFIGFRLVRDREWGMGNTNLRLAVQGSWKLRIINSVHCPLPIPYFLLTLTFILYF